VSLALGVWVVLAIVSTAALLVCLLGLVSNLRALLRTLGRFKDEVEPVSREISDEGTRTASRSAALRVPGSEPDR
jgi:hypothetical protein